MPDEPKLPEPSLPSPETQLDSAQLQYALQLLRAEQNLFLAILAGTVAAGVGAAAWAAITVATGSQLGIVAVGIGLAVGYAVRATGKGIDPQFGVVGAVLALTGCLAGNLLAVCALVARREGIPLDEVLQKIDFPTALRLLAATFQVTDLIFYGIAVYEGYRLSFRPVTAEEVGRRLGTHL